MTYSGDHLLDETLSALLDNQLDVDAAQRARTHTDRCSACQQRLDELHMVVGLLRALPEVDPPREFRLGPRRLIDPPNVVRLRRWYGIARAGAASLAAIFVFMSVGALYIDSRPAPGPTTLDSPQRVAVSAPTAAVQSAPTVLLRQAAPAAAARPAGPTPQGADSDQVAAATSVRPLPTPVPTPVPPPVPPPAPPPVTSLEVDPAAPVRIGAAIVGVLAALTLVATLIVRHRLESASRYL